VDFLTLRFWKPFAQNTHFSETKLIKLAYFDGRPIFGYQKHRRSQKWFPQTWGTIGEVFAGVPPAGAPQAARTAGARMVVVPPAAVAVAGAGAAFSPIAGS
jgi:hypothetical protein